MKTNYCIAVFVVLAALLGSVFFVEGYADEADATTSGDDGNIHWEISDGTLTITKKEGATSGKMKDYDHDKAPWLDDVGSDHKFIETVTHVIIGEGVTYIGAHSFPGILDEYTVTISDSVTKIGEYSFAVSNRLKSVTFGNNVEEIGECAFSATGIDRIVIPESVKTIGKYAFRNSEKVGTVTFLAKEWDLVIGEDAFLLLQSGGESKRYPVYSVNNIAKDKLIVSTEYTEFEYLPLPMHTVTIESATGIDYSTTTIEVIGDKPINVVIDASSGYYFPADYSVKPGSGINVTRLSDSQIRVSGTPTGDVTVRLAPATLIYNPVFDEYEDNWYYLHMLKQRAAQQQTTYTDNSEEETAIVAIAAAGVAAALLGIIVLLYRRP